MLVSRHVLADTQTLMAQGQGQVSIGGGVAQAGALTSQMGQSSYQQDWNL